MTRARIITLALVLAAVAAVAIIIYLRRTAPETREAYIAERETSMLARAAQTGKVDTVVLGDSIAEMNELDDLCGATFNAGVGGAAIEDLRRFAPAVIRMTRPARIVLAVGTNDVLLGGPHVARFRTAYAALIDSLPIAPFVLVGVERGDNAFIRSEAERIGAAYVPPVARSLTYDGVHPTAAGLKLWRERVGAACPG
jgi:lysophospholipase L1-like esterase